MTVQTLRKWNRQATIDESASARFTTDVARQIRDLKGRSVELECPVEIMKAATALVAQEFEWETSLMCLLIVGTSALLRRAWEERSDGDCLVLTEHGWGDHAEVLAAMVASIGSIDHASDPAVAETMIGLYNAECPARIRRFGPGR